MKIQVSINLDLEDLESLDRLADIEHRSRSEMGAIIIRQHLAQLREEYRQNRALPSLPKQHILSTWCWDAECEALFGKL